MATRARKLSKTVHSSDLAGLCTLMIAARKQAGITQTQLAARLKRPQSFVAKYEGGERRLDVIEFIFDSAGAWDRSGQAPPETNDLDLDSKMCTAC